MLTMNKPLEFLFCSTLVGTMTACGGGGGTNGSQTTPSNAAAQTVTQLCGVDVGTTSLIGSVTNVHDGDTFTLSSSGSTYNIRLDTIDAPELAQPYGPDSQVALSNKVLGKNIRVQYSKTDQYGRIVGAVFTDSCEYVNLTQVVEGMAWFYKAYQCEVSASVRSAFTQAQDNAVLAHVGLWAQASPEAPWFFRNGVEPVTPTCSGALPSWSSSTALTSVGATTAAGSTSTVTSTGTLSSSICYTGPRGGTYTITASGNKNYGGC